MAGVYALTSTFDGTTWAIVGENGRFPFPAEDGPTIASMMCDQFADVDDEHERDDD